jgi:thiamine-phosphate pyrophosphorylase
MANSSDVRTRLVLVTPAAYDVASQARHLAAALAGGDVASLIVTPPDNADPGSLERAARAFVPLATERDVATLVLNDTRVAGRTGADGVHVEAGLDEVRTAVDWSRGKKIVGAGNVPSRHDAMELAEAEPDYMFFGRLTGDTSDGIFPKARELAEWWSEVAVVPAIVMGGRSLSSVAEAAAAGVEFVALARAIWEDPRGPGAAVADAAERLASRAEPVA